MHLKLQSDDVKMFKAYTATQTKHGIAMCEAVSRTTARALANSQLTFKHVLHDC